MVPLEAVPSTATSDAPDDGTRAVHPTLATNESSSRLRTFTGRLTSRINRVIIILMYPFAVIFTVASLLLVITFCVFPTLICMTFAVCIYYCMMDDPIPLSVLLRYMLSPDPDDNNYPNSGSYSQSRGSIQAKLIIRKLLRIEDIQKNEEGSEVIDKAKGNSEEVQPRCHPFPIEFQTGQKCLHFSEPIVYEEKGETQEEKDSESRRVPLYHQPDRSAADEENALDTLDVVLAVPPDDDELGLVEIAIGAAYSDELSTTEASYQQCDPTSRQVPLADDANDVPSTCENEIKESSATTKGANSNAPGTMVAEQLEEAMELVEDYFGITNARERGTTCDICLLDFEVGEEVAWSPNPECVHSFHKDCVLDWLIRKPSCPSCRNNFLEGTGGGEANPS